MMSTPKARYAFPLLSLPSPVTHQDVLTPIQTWPVCHIKDNTQLYAELLLSILNDESPDYGKNGYYLAASGSVAWADIYSAMAKVLAKRGVIENAQVRTADDAALAKMAQVLECPKELVAVQIGGK
jgi:hypothetical protein